MSLPELPDGHNFKVTHMRYYQTDHYGRATEEVDPKGGMTHVGVYKGDELVAEATAECSVKDNYDKRLGTTIALGRALKELRSTA